jgi:hypothetical protein
MSRAKEGRDALRSSEAHPQARSICACAARVEPKTSSCWPPPPKTYGNWQSSSPSRRRSSPPEVQRASSASPKAAYDAKRRGAETEFFNKIHVKQTLRISAVDVAARREGPRVSGANDAIAPKPQHDQRPAHRRSGESRRGLRRKRELKRGPLWRVCLGPGASPVRFDDHRAAFVADTA